MISSKAKALKLQEVRVKMGMFDFDVICIAGDYDKAAEYVAWKFEEKEFDAQESNKGYEPRGKCFFRTGYVPVVWIPKKPKTAREYATLSHECLHATMHLFDWAAVPTTPHTEEVMCHAMAHLITNILEGLK